MHFKGAEPIIGFERGEVQKKGDAQLEEGQCAIRRRAMRNLHRRLVAAEEAEAAMTMGDNGRRRIVRRSKLLVLAASRESAGFCTLCQ